MSFQPPRPRGVIDPITFILVLAVAGMVALAILFSALAEMTRQERAACELRLSKPTCTYMLSR